MALLDGGLNRVRDLFHDDIYSGTAGTGTTAVSFTDTSLVTEVATAEDLSPTLAKSTRTITMTHFIPTTSANGSALTEWGIEVNGGSTLAVRSLTAPVSKTSAIEVNRITLIYFDRK